MEQIQQNQPQPWVRYFARAFDITLFSIVVYFIIRLFYHGQIIYSRAYIYIPITFIWVYVEGLIISRYGTTLGKWLLNTKITTSVGGKPDLTTATNRSLLVWLKGLGLGLPLVTIITKLYQLNRISKITKASWDQKLNLEVVHTNIPKARAWLFVFLFIFVNDIVNYLTLLNYKVTFTNLIYTFVKLQISKFL